MNILYILWKEFRQNIRNWKANSMMILFPIVLIIILGAAFAQVFDNSVKLNDAKVLYTLEDKTGLSQYFEEFKAQGKELGILFEETSDVDEGIKSVQDVTYSCYILVEEGTGKVSFYKNARYNFEAGFVEGYINIFIQRYNVFAEIAKTNPAALSKAFEETGREYAKMASLDTKKQPRSIDYYSITMLTLILMYASLTGMYGIKSEQNMKTGNRILCGPVRKYEYLTGKVTGGVMVTIVQALIVILFSKYVMNANWGSDILTILVLVLAQSVMTISIGAGIAYLVSNEGAASGILNTIIPVIVLFGGGYTPLEQMGEAMVRISVFSPVRWVNNALFRMIYDSDYSLVLPAILINLAVAMVFIMAAAMISRKEVV